jgi:hypothetical protein
MDLDNKYSVGLVLCHGLLSSSSMIFHISSVRNKNAPMIYPEFRLHSIIFALRSVMCFLLTYYKFSILYRFGACYLTMICADIVTYNLGNKNGGTTMRNMPFDTRIPDNEQNKIAHLQSCSQISATLFMLGNLDSCFSPLLPIQIAAFLMTTVRKGIINANMWHIIYNFSLWSNVFIFYTVPYDYIALIIILYAIFKYIRFDMAINKYIVWSLIFSLFYFYDLYYSKTVNNFITEGEYMDDNIILKKLILDKYIIHLLVLRYLFLNFMNSKKLFWFYLF